MHPFVRWSEHVYPGCVREGGVCLLNWKYILSKVKIHVGTVNFILISHLIWRYVHVKIKKIHHGAVLLQASAAGAFLSSFSVAGSLSCRFKVQCEEQHSSTVQRCGPGSKWKSLKLIGKFFSRIKEKKSNIKWFQLHLKPSYSLCPQAELIDHC